MSVMELCIVNLLLLAVAFPKRSIFQLFPEIRFFPQGYTIH